MCIVKLRYLTLILVFTAMKSGHTEVNPLTGQVTDKIELCRISTKSPSRILEMQLLYNGRGVQKAMNMPNHLTPYGCYGYGWDLTLPYIAAAHHGTSYYDDDDWYIRDWDGNVNSIVNGNELGTEKFWIRQKPFCKVTALKDNSEQKIITGWCITELDGTVYEYGVQNINGIQQSDAVSWLPYTGNQITPDGVNHFYYRWYLKRIRYNEGGELTFAYNSNTSCPSCNTNYIKETYLHTITSDNGTIATFTYANRTQEESKPGNEDVLDRFPLFYGQYLQSMSVQNGAGQNVDLINFTYELRNSTQNGFAKRLLKNVSYTKQDFLSASIEYENTGLLATKRSNAGASQSYIYSTLSNVDFASSLPAPFPATEFEYTKAIPTGRHVFVIDSAPEESIEGSKFTIYTRKESQWARYEIPGWTNEFHLGQKIYPYGDRFVVRSALSSTCNPPSSYHWIYTIWEYDGNDWDKDITSGWRACNESQIVSGINFIAFADFEAETRNTNLPYTLKRNIAGTWQSENFPGVTNIQLPPLVKQDARLFGYGDYVVLTYLALVDGTVYRFVQATRWVGNRWVVSAPEKLFPELFPPQQEHSTVKLFDDYFIVHKGKPAQPKGIAIRRWQPGTSSWIPEYFANTNLKINTNEGSFLWPRNAEIYPTSNYIAVLEQGSVNWLMVYRYKKTNAGLLAWQRDYLIPRTGFPDPAVADAQHTFTDNDNVTAQHAYMKSFPYSIWEDTKLYLACSDDIISVGFTQSIRDGSYFYPQYMEYFFKLRKGVESDANAWESIVNGSYNNATGEVDQFGMGYFYINYYGRDCDLNNITCPECAYHKYAELYGRWAMSSQIIDSRTQVESYFGRCGYGVGTTYSSFFSLSNYDYNLKSANRYIKLFPMSDSRVSPRMLWNQYSGWHQEWSANVGVLRSIISLNDRMAVEITRDNVIIHDGEKEMRYLSSPKVVATLKDGPMSGEAFIVTNFEYPNNNTERVFDYYSGACFFGNTTIRQCTGIGSVKKTFSIEPNPYFGLLKDDEYFSANDLSVQKISTKYKLINVNLGALTPVKLPRIESTTSKINGVVKKDDYEYNAINGIASIVKTKNSDGSEILKEIKFAAENPEYEDNMGPDGKNMLVQSCQTIMYGQGAAVGSEKYATSATATTWSNDLGGTNWVPHKTFVWKADCDKDGIPKLPFTEFAFNNLASNFSNGWVCIQTNTHFNKYGSITEMACAGPNNKEVYNATVIRNDRNVLAATIANARFNECSVFTCDYDLDEDGFFDKENGWAHHDGPLPAGSICQVEATYPHFGQKSLHVKNAKAAVHKIAANSRTAKISWSAWVRPENTNPIRFAASLISNGVGNNSVFYNYQYTTTDGLKADGTWQLVKYEIDISKPSTGSAPLPTDFDGIGDDGIYTWIGNHPSEAAAEFFIDDIRICPKNALVTSTYYEEKWFKPILSVDANCNPSHKVVYDDFSRPVRWYKVDKTNPANVTLLQEKEYHVMGENRAPNQLSGLTATSTYPTVSFSWNGGDPDENDNVNYRVEIYHIIFGGGQFVDAELSKIEKGSVTTVSVSGSPTIARGSYYWRVIADDGFSRKTAEGGAFTF